MRARTKTVRNGWLTLCAVASTVAAARGDDAKPSAVQLARFAIIYPEADPEMEEKRLSPGASWLLRPRTSARKLPAPSAAKRRQAAPNAKTAERVTPLRRDRPKRETNPPKTRRPNLGW